MAEAKTYVGSCKEISTQYGTIMKLEFSKKNLETLLANLNERGYAKLVVAPRKEIGQYGDTHTVALDTYVPKDRDVQPDAPEDVAPDVAKTASSGQKSATSKYPVEEISVDELPF